MLSHFLPRNAHRQLLQLLRSPLARHHNSSSTSHHIHAKLKTLKQVVLSETPRRHELETQISDLWTEPHLSKEFSSLSSRHESYARISSEVHELLDLQNLDVSEQEMTWVIEQLQVFDKELEGLVQSVLFDMEIDSSDCWIELASGSGGDDAMDFTQLLAQMYTKWGGREGFQVILEDVSHGDLAGFRKARLSVMGENAYGWLAGETGIHRLIRNSPFNKTNTRETSFARVDCVPKVQTMSNTNTGTPLVVSEAFDSSEVEISTFKSGGAGGQHANTTDSAVRVVHHPTGIVVKCSKERSQHANKKRCLSILRGRLHKLQEMAESVTQQEKYRAYEDNSFGSHFRSYHLVTGMLKDTRSSFEGSNALRVLTEGIGLQEILVCGLHARKGV